jgi:hypothetical protein
MRIRRAGLLVAALAASFEGAASAPPLVVRLEGERLRVAAPNLRFLSGRPLERLRNGAPVVFDAQLELRTGGSRSIRERTAARCVVSYDLWEERFSVARTGGSTRLAARLTAAAAEASCLEALVLPAAGLAPDESFWIRLELRAEDPRERPAVVGEPGISLTRLIELFSRPARDPQVRWVEQAGPLRLSDLTRTNGRREGGRGPAAW